MSAIEPARLATGRPQVHLTGFMGSGKSTVGRLLAQRLLWNFLDLDGVVERHAGKPVARIFAEHGEAHFRDAERYVLRQVVGKPRTVLALGGGTLIDEANQQLCRRHATVIWLKCPLEIVRARCAGSATRPLWGDGELLEERHAERLPGYESADLIADASARPEAVVDEVLQLLGVTDR